MTNEPLESAERRGGNIFAAIFVCLAAGLILAGILYHRNFEAQYRAEAGRGLSSVAWLKSEEVEHYRRIQLEHAAIFVDNTAFYGLLRSYLAGRRDKNLESQLREWLAHISSSGSYDQVRILGARGAALLSFPASIPPLDPAVTRQAVESVRTGRAEFTDFYREANDNTIHLAVTAPIIDLKGKKQPLGVLVFRADPSKYLYPVLQRWPVPSRTAETLLVRRDGGDALFLTPLRFRNDAPLKLRIPLSRTEVPAVRAVLGRTGVAEGIDYYGVPVLADTRPIPGSPWSMVARIDLSEVTAPLRERLWKTILFTLLLLAGAGTALALVWKQRNVGFYKERYAAAEALRESEENLRRAQEMAKLGSWRYSLSGRISWSDALYRIYGVSPETFTPALESLFGLIHPEDRPAMTEWIRACGAGEKPGELVFRVVDPDGSVRFISGRGELVRGPDGKPAYLAGTAQDITERSRTEQELRKLSLAVRESPASIVITDAAGRIEYVNRRFTEVTGYTFEEVKGGNPRILKSGTQPPEVYREFWKTISSGELWHGEFHNKKKSGELYWEAVSVSPLRNTEGAITHFVAVKEDITRQKAAKAILESRSLVLERFSSGGGLGVVLDALILHLDAIFPGQPAAVRLLAEDGKHLLPGASRGLPEFYNKAVDGMEIGPAACCCGAAAYMKKRVVAEDLEDHFKGAPFGEVARRAGIGSCWAEPILASNGKVLGVLAVYGPKPAAFGQLDMQLLGETAGLAGMAIERLKAEAALAESEKKFKALFTGARDAIFLVNIDKDGLPGNFSEINDIACERLGYTREELLKLSPRDITAPESVADMPAVMRRLAEKGHVVFEVMDRTKDNRLIPEEISLQRLEMPGQPRLLAITRDITERKKFETDLRRAKEEAEAANRAKSAFLANMSHEIRTPMNAILGFSQLMRRDPAATPEQKQQLETINLSGEHLLALINDILEMSKAEAGRATLNPSAFDLHAMAGDLEKMLRPRAEAKGLRLETELGAGLPRLVTGDEGKLRQILLNLFGNALKFTEKGAVILRLGVLPGAGPGFRLRAEVEDTGPGIDPLELGTLFRPFEQAQAGRAAGTGTGLGLAISREYARLMGGEIKVKSLPGQGSVFSLEIDLKEARQPAAVLKPRPLPQKKLKPGQPQCRVLVADDNEDNRELLARMLGPAGFEVRQADNGEQALTEFQVWRPQLILMDLEMPVMDGYEAIRRIWACSGGGETKILILTASVFGEASRNVGGTGADDLLLKPFRDLELFAKIRALLGAEYLCEEEVLAAIPGPADAGTPKPASAAVLPRELLSRLHEAVKNGDFDLVAELAGEVEAHNTGLAGMLRGLAGEFDLRGILALLAKEMPHDR